LPFQTNKWNLIFFYFAFSRPCFSEVSILLLQIFMFSIFNNNKILSTLF